jgi:hypothetical protein
MSSESSKFNINSDAVDQKFVKEHLLKMQDAAAFAAAAACEAAAAAELLTQNLEAQNELDGCLAIDRETVLLLQQVEQHWRNAQLWYVCQSL